MTDTPRPACVCGHPADIHYQWRCMNCFDGYDDCENTGVTAEDICDCGCDVDEHDGPGCEECYSCMGYQRPREARPEPDPDQLPMFTGPSHE